MNNYCINTYWYGFVRNILFQNNYVYICIYFLIKMIRLFVVYICIFFEK